MITTVVGFMLATGIAVGATTGTHARSNGNSATEVAAARAALLAALANRTGNPVAAPASAGPADTSGAADTPAPAPAASTPLVAPATTTRATTPADDTTTTPDDDTDTTPTGPDTTSKLPNITNTWVIALPATSINADDLESAPSNFVRDAITPQGVQLTGYSLLSATAPVNGIAAVSGQPPNLATGAGCTTRADVPASSIDAKTGIATGDGCLYPTQVTSIASQLAAGGSVVRTYEAAAPAGAGCADSTTAANPRAPLPYFHAFTDDAALCADRTGDAARLTADLADPDQTPALSWIVAPDDPTAAAEFTANTLAAIEDTAAYKKGGLILVLPDSPAAATPTDLVVGAVAISPFIPSSTQNASAFGPYGVLRLFEDLFTLPALAGAGAEDVQQVDRSIFQSTASGARAQNQPTRSSS